MIYSRNGVKVTATPVEHYMTGGPSALRVDWNGLSFTYSGTKRATCQHLIVFTSCLCELDAINLRIAAETVRIALASGMEDTSAGSILR